MNTKVSVLITTFQRNNLLKLCLPTVTKQNPHQIIVINDGIEDGSKEIAKANGVEYLFTGQRNAKKLNWRVPGYALNIAAKHFVTGDLIIISCAEIYHIGNTLNEMVPILESNPTAIPIPTGFKDTDKRLTAEMLSGKKLDTKFLFYCDVLDTMLPFFLPIWTSVYKYIGGYDEDFTGQAFDDNDFVERVLCLGFDYRLLESQIVHMWHTTQYPDRDQGAGSRWLLNQRLFHERKGQVFRNTDKEWGQWEL